MCECAATTTVYPSTNAEDVAYILADSECRVVFAEDESQLAKLKERKSELPHLDKVVVIDGEGDGVSVLATLRNDATAVRLVSSVDDSDGPMGQASIVHALVEQAAGRTGQYGLAPGADAPFAPVPAS